MRQREIFPLNHPIVIEHYITLLTIYYKKLQHEHYKHITNTYFFLEQNKDSRFIPPPTTIPLTHIFIKECNPKKYIVSNKYTTQINNEQAHLYEDTGKHLTTISTTRLKWLWQQYNKASYSSHCLVPQIQSFEKKSYMALLKIQI